MPPVKDGYTSTPWLKSQVRSYLINLRIWVKDGYRFTEEEQEKLKAILEEGKQG